MSQGLKCAHSGCLLKHIEHYADLAQNKLATLKRKLESSGAKGKIIYRAADVGEYKIIDQAVASAVEELGTIDILVNNVRLPPGTSA